MSTLLGDVLELTVSLSQEETTEGKRLGKAMFTMYTQNGFPPDMFFDQLEARTVLPKAMKLAMLNEYQRLFLEHRRKAGISEDRVEKIRDQNRKILADFMRTGEVGVY